MEISFILTNIVLFVGLYFSFFWVLVLLNSDKRRQFKIKNYPDVSVLVPAYNEEKTIGHTINSLLSVKYKGKLDIIVINDGSKDNTLKVLEKFGNKIKIIDKKKNAGKAAAINSGLELVNTEFVAIVDADSEVSVSSVENSIKHFYVEDGEKIGAVISKMRPINESGSLLERIEFIEYLMVGLIRSLTASLALLHLTPGVLSVYRTPVIKKLGGFDENNLTEDFEAGVRIRKAGYLIEYAYDSLVFTNTPNKFRVFLKQRVRWSRGFIQTHKKHKDIFFNKKYGLFGLYKFPMNVLGPVILFIAVGLIGFKVYKEIYEFLYKIINAPDTISWFSFDRFYDYVLTIDPTIDFMVLFAFMMVLFLMFSLIRFYDYNFLKKDTLKKLWAVVMYILVYNYVYIYIWIVSIYKESLKRGYDWGTKK